MRKSNSTYISSLSRVYYLFSYLICGSIHAIQSFFLSIYDELTSTTLYMLKLMICIKLWFERHWRIFCWRHARLLYNILNLVSMVSLFLVKSLRSTSKKIIVLNIHFDLSIFWKFKTWKHEVLLRVNTFSGFYCLEISTGQTYCFRSIQNRSCSDQGVQVNNNYWTVWTQTFVECKQIVCSELIAVHQSDNRIKYWTWLNSGLCRLEE